MLHTLSFADIKLIASGKAVNINKFEVVDHQHSAFK